MTEHSSPDSPVVSRPVVSRLRAESRGRPEFLATGTPTLSWAVRTAQPGWMQARAEIDISVGGRSETYAVTGPRSQAVAWPAAALPAYGEASIRVRVQAAGGEWSPLSEPLLVRTGPLGPDDWAAEFIASPTPIATDSPLEADRPVTRFAHAFEPAGPVLRATLSATAHGVYEPNLNGAVVGDEVLAPGWTVYQERLLFQSFDVTELITPGVNVLGATVADGWYRERYGFNGSYAVAYDGPSALSLQLHLSYADGSTELIVTGEGWRASHAGPTTSASLYQGERYDARRETGLLEEGLPEGAPAIMVEAERDRLEPAAAPPIRRTQELAVAEVITSPSGTTILDFGQNLVGWLRITDDSPAGTVTTLRHAEVLEHGELGVRPLRAAAQTDTFTSSGSGPRQWEPRFTFHGFRYAEVTVSDPSLRIDPAHFTAIVVHSDMERTGTFSTDNALLNQLHENVVWGMRGNFVGLPTDCPQRDERLGWTGDIQAFAPTASYLYDTTGFLGSWLRDLAVEQRRFGGSVPPIVPTVIGDMPVAPAAAWGDAATFVPEALHAAYGDDAALAERYESMTAWVDTILEAAGDDFLWTGGFQFGDWLDPTAPPHDPAAAKTPSDIVATAYLFRSATIMAQTAARLGHDDDARRFGAAAESTRAAFLHTYVTPAGLLLSDSATAYALAIVFRIMTDPVMVRAAGRRLAELIRSHGYRVQTGFVGTPLICEALQLGGEPDAAFRHLLEEGCPSWLYPITMGATTVWERWDSILPDGSINPGEMTSFNHYALGAVAGWMHRSIGGIAPAEPGYSRALIAPTPGPGILAAEAKLETGYGPLSVSWRQEGDEFTLRASVPPNTSADVVLPGSTEPIRVGSGEHEWRVAHAAPAGRPAPVTLDTELSQVVDDAEARRVLERVFAEVGYTMGLGWNAGGRWKSGAALGGAMFAINPEQRAAVVAALDELNAGRALPR